MHKRFFLFLCLAILAITPVDMLEGEERASGGSNNPPTAEASAAYLPTAEFNIGTAFWKAAAVEKLSLSPEAVDVIIKEVINRESYRGIPLAQISISNSEAIQLAEAIATKARGEEVTASLIADFIAEEKTKQIKDTLPSEISRITRITRIELTATAEKLLRADLLAATERAAKSGLSIDEIRSRIKRYLNTIFFTHTSSKVLDEQTYNRYKSMLFKPVILLTICSVPCSADVEFKGIWIGKTTFEKPFESDEEYVFTFHLSGYKTGTRKYFVDPYIMAPVLTEILIEEREEKDLWPYKWQN